MRMCIVGERVEMRVRSPLIFHSRASIIPSRGPARKGEFVPNFNDKARLELWTC